MRIGVLPIRAVVFAAYLLATILPLFAVAAGLPQTDVQHARMMAVAGHTMPMQDAATGGDDASMQLCQQHCLQAVAALPRQGLVAEEEVILSVAVVAADKRLASVALSPPGPPPKVAMV